jgi:N-acetylmuramoyl-L-alanine amidase
MKIFIDPGHNNSGYDTGAAGNGLHEQDITYQIGRKLADRLTSRGISVKMSRETIASNVGTKLDESINGRCAMANAWGADYFISIHCNAAADQSANGAEVLIYGDRVKELAKLICSDLARLGLTDRGVKQRANLGVLKHTNMPALLVETAFISNARDAAFLRDRQDDIAAAIANAVFEFLGIEIEETEENEMPEYLERKYRYCDDNIPYGLKNELQEAIALGVVSYGADGFNPPLCEIEVRTAVMVKRGVESHADDD